MTTENRAAGVLPRHVFQRLERAVEGADNPVAAVRALRRAAARLPVRYQGQRDALRWASERALRPFFRKLKGDTAAKAAIWAVLDGLWDGSDRSDKDSQNGANSRELAPRLEEAAARMRSAMFR